MKNDANIGVFLCECGGKISSRIDLPKVCEFIRYSSWKHLEIYPHPCLAPGLDAIRAQIQAHGLDRILIGGCSSRVM